MKQILLTEVFETILFCCSPCTMVDSLKLKPDHLNLKLMQYKIVCLCLHSPSVVNHHMYSSVMYSPIPSIPTCFYAGFKRTVESPF